jgi:hypothetical protein
MRINTSQNIFKPWSNSAPENILGVVLGECRASKAIASIFDFRVVCDRLLSATARAVAIRPPKFMHLTNCQFVVLVEPPCESISTLRWRKHLFWHIYKCHGGSLRSVPGLRWAALQPRTRNIPPCSQPPETSGLSQVINQFAGSEPVTSAEWELMMHHNRELALRREIQTLLLQNDDPIRRQRRISKLAEHLSAAAWEDFCPRPGHHAMANQIRAWLTKGERANSVPQWLAQGHALFLQTNIT